MRNHVLSIFAFTFICLISFSQPYGNEWIDYDQSYYKFAVSQDGVYRIDQAGLIAAGIPITSIDPRNIQIFGRGLEIDIHIQGESDGSFDSGDYIEFYALANDGFYDESLYPTPKDHAHPAYSLFSDSIYYFITWNNSTTNKRFQAETDISFTSYTTLPFVWKHSLKSRNNQYFEGETFTGGATDPTYEASEGWFDFYISLGSARTHSVQTPRAYTSGPDAIVKWKITGQSNYAPLNLDHHLTVQVAGINFDTIYEGYQVIEKQFSVPVNALNAFNTPFVFTSVNDLGSQADRSAVAYAEVIYPHLLNFNNQTSYTFFLPDNTSQAKAYLPITNFNSNGTVWLYDLSNSKRIRVITTGSNQEVLVPNSGSDKECHIFSEGNVQMISAIKEVKTGGKFTDFSTLEFPNTFLIISHIKLMNSAGQYANYKNSTGYASLLVDIDELYDQFALGISHHPLSIRNFVDYLFDTWTDDPSYLFLLGKSVKAHLFRQNAANTKLDLVPTFGNPSSDNLLTAGLGQSVLQPLIRTGRLSAQNNQEADEYLQKVIEYEGNSPSPWMKNALHFAGGTSQQEADRFESYLGQFEDVLKDTSFGAEVYTFKKSTTAPYQIALSDSIKGLINNGASFMTFFGHASASGGFDQNIDEPESFNNKGKYPFLIGNSCFTGDIHLATDNSTSEKFVLIKDKGVIAFLASVDLGFEGKLRDYSLAFFNSFSKYNYGLSIGEHMAYSIQEIEKTGVNFSTRSICNLMTLHGDPSLVINSPPLPDYSIVSSGVTTYPDPLTTQADTFELVLDIYNYGRALSDSLMIEVIRIFPNQENVVYTVNSKPVYYKNQVVIKIPIDKENGPGFNRFDISLDPSNLIPEFDESNNFISVNYFIKSGDLIPVMPYEFAVVPEWPELFASTGNAFEGYKNYVLQIDTNDKFTQPLFQSSWGDIGGVYNKTPFLVPNSIKKDNTVYYWRTRNSDDVVNSIWRTSSFKVVPGKRGWSQSHFNQFERNRLEFMQANQSNRRFEFQPSVKKLTCQTIWNSPGDYSQLGNILYKLDADLKEYGGCGLASALHIAVLDSLSFEPWGTPYQGQNSNHYFGQANFDGNCGKPRIQNQFIFRANDVAQLAGMKDMLQNKIPDGNYILAWTWLRNDFTSWDAIDPSLRNVFVNLGADSISSISNDSLPYIFFVKKGKVNTAQEVIGSRIDEFITMSANLSNYSSYGNVISQIIGPSSNWDSISWSVFSPDNPSSDSAVMSVGVMSEKSQLPYEILMMDKSISDEDLSPIANADNDPFMELNAFISDQTFQTAAQVSDWTILYDGVAELALNARRSDLYLFSDTIQEGEDVSLKIEIRNLSSYASDSVRILAYVLDANRERRDVHTSKHQFMEYGAWDLEINFNSYGFVGSNTLVIDVNPGLEKPEQTYFNNVGQLPFYVVTDKVKPVLDVTFDGRHILDGDIISSKPEIAMQISDDNPVLILNDTSDIQVYLTDPIGNEHQAFFTNSTDLYSMTFIPGNQTNNEVKVLFQPNLVVDGLYRLRVKATDRSKNESGKSDYEISFEVINRSTITELLNYPNPFSTSTRFVFVLTGSRVPDAVQIQIMTVSGKLVKTIEGHELGPIHIGRNITEYAWDGRDDFGDKLANGVYLYRVKTVLDGFDIEHRSTEADQYFKKGFGKMVILR